MIDKICGIATIFGIDECRMMNEMALESKEHFVLLKRMSA
jgi:hypothetical protein